MRHELNVAIVTCEEEDFESMAPVIDVLERFDVPYEIVAINYLTAPHRVAEYATQVRARGVSVILAGTGDAPMLPALLATHTTLPVIGVPLPCRIVGGDPPPASLVTMPPGVPVATVASSDVCSAAFAAIRILALRDARLVEALDQAADIPAASNEESL